MKKLLLVPLFGMALSSCNIIDDNISALEYNQEQIQASTVAIRENAQAVSAANVGIDQNRRELEQINQTLEKIK
jgi:hypothetical protein